MTAIPVLPITAIRICPGEMDANQGLVFVMMWMATVIPGVFALS